MRLLMAILLLIFINNCSGPDYKKPKINMPSKWENTSSLIENKAFKEKELAWWKLFKDQQLEELITNAINSNLDIKSAKAKIYQARAMLSGTTANLFPNITGVGSLSNIRISENYSKSLQQNLTSNPTVNGNLFTVGFDSIWELDFFGGKRRAVEASKANLESVSEEANGVILSLISEIAQNYINLRSNQMQLALLKEISNLFKENKTLNLL